MNVSKPALLSVVLLAVSTGLWIPYILNVKVVNLPVDEQGNLKVKIVDEKPLQTYKDAMEIDVLGWVTRQWADYGYQKEWGIYVRKDWDADLAFVFSPKQSLFNITNMVVVIYATDGIDDFTLSINGRETYVGNVEFPVDLPSTKLIQLDPNLIQINEGINLLRMSGSGTGYLSIYEVSLLIEYEY